MDKATIPDTITIFVPFGVICVPAQTIARIEGWARWVRPGMGLDPHGRCASIEGRYVSQFPEGKDSASTPLDLLAVLDVEQVVSTKLPKVGRDIVRQYFVRGYTPHAIARNIGIHRADFGAELKRSIHMIKNNLTNA